MTSKGPFAAGRAESTPKAGKQAARNLWYLQPVELIGQIWDFFSHWLVSRSWKKVLVFLPPMLLLVALASVILVGKTRSHRSLSQFYEQKARQLVAEKNDPKSSESATETDAAETQKQLRARDEEIDLLFRRVLQLGNDNLEARFFVAEQNLRSGKLGVARAMIRELAPSDRPGLKQAHAWLAQDLLRRSAAGEQVPFEELKFHLAQATSDPSLQLEPALYIVQAKILEQSGRLDEAIGALMKAGEVEPRFQLEAIVFCIQRQLGNQAKGCADQLVSRLRRELDSVEKDDQAKTEAVLGIAQAFLLTNRVDEAIQVLNNVLAIRQDSPVLKRTLSDSYRLKFRASLEQARGQIQVNMDLLNLAISADPSNLAIQSELSMLGSMGVMSDEKNRDLLRNTIAANGASFAARLLLAEASIAKEEWDNASIHYEVVLAELPNMTLALNNLAMILIKKDPPNIEEARAAIAKALEFSPDAPEFYDSKGDIERVADDLDAAKLAYSDALKRNPEMRSTRLKLVGLLEKENQTELIQEHRNIMEQQDKARQAALESMQNSKPAPSTEATTQPVPPIEATSNKSSEQPSSPTGAP